MRWLVLCMTLAAIFSPISAKAQCTLASNGETRPEGRMIYNADYDVHQVCLDGQWKAVEPIGCAAGDGCVPDPCTGTQTAPSIGDTCTDGSVYAGLSPDGNVAMYTTPADAPSTYTWNDGSNNFLDTAMDNCTAIPGPTPNTCQTGEANTVFLIAQNGSGTPAPYAAAVYCNDLSVHGHDDWYLPAQDELNVLYNNRASIGNFDKPGFPLYWTSSERDNTQAVFQRFTDGYQDGETKSGDQYVRCVRKE
mgnify:CR=1 FL=1|jgi:hypothetical protein